jgi:hypothetical protein
MQNNIIDDNGIFWWRTSNNSKNNSSPDTGITGRLFVTEDGLISLELHGILTASDNFLTNLFSDNRETAEDELTIQGRLKSNGEHVILLGVIMANGRASFGGISYEVYTADTCLLGNYPFRDHGELLFNCLYVDLSGFEDWLNIRPIATVKTRRSTKITAKPPKLISYKLDGGDTLSINSYLSGEPPTGSMNWSHLHLTLKTAIKIRFTKYKSVNQNLSEFKKVAYFLQLVTGSDYNLPWPTFMTGSVKKEKSYHTAYFYRRTNSASKPALHSAWLNLTTKKEQFCALYNIWRSRIDDLGPSVGLYFAARKSFKLYAENRFVNLIWGLESLHRLHYPVLGPDPQEMKALRIFDQIVTTGVLNSDERRWLKKKLLVSYEQNLSSRINQCIKDVGLEFDDKSLSAFTDRCAEIRNDISHFGGQRIGSSYPDLLQEITDKTEILLILYASILLAISGVPTESLNHVFWRGRIYPPLKRLLIKESLLKRT